MANSGTDVFGVHIVKGLLTLTDDNGVAKDHHVDGLLTLTCAADSTAIAPPLSDSPPISTAAKPLGLLDLDQDVLGCIFDYIRRPADRLACIYTCKTFSVLVIPRLYKRLDIRATGCVTSNHAGLLAKGNPGLQYTKTVILRGRGPTTPDNRSFAPFLINVMRAIPRAQLDHFHGGAEIDLPASVTTLLWQRQPNLQRLELFTEHNAVSDAVFAVPGEEVAFGKERPFANVTDLMVVPQNEASLLAASKAIEGSPVDTLTLNFQKYEGPEGYLDAETGEVHNCIEPLLLQHLTRQVAAGIKWPGLRSLSIDNMGFGFCRQATNGPFQYLDFSTLECLSVANCQDVDLFFFEMYSRGPPRLKELHVVHTLAAPQPDRIFTALNECLIGIKGRLAKLTLVLRNVSGEPSADTRINLQIINRHRKTLKQLTLDLRGPSGQEFNVDPSNVRLLLHDCFALRQLAMNLPTPNLEYAQWAGVLSDGEETNGSSEALDAIMANTSLTIVTFTSWPGRYELQNYRKRKPLLQRMATDMFATFREFTPDDDSDRPRRKLEVIVFGVAEEESPKPPVVYYVEAEVKCLFTTYRIAQETTQQALLYKGMAGEDGFLDYAPRKTVRNSAGDDD
ncbi:hypothetical protein LTR36_000128 [Oleoguttula mirabilis]|uniref:F-box domain-containing protein n=1 Tax=Oleoguttula mirabilis TaxID=1507867 RepID=A0AAV9JY34_9PEZI|nr:hypothetical protein LTR36_000128 [Oleoguttula mirabilis]